MSMSITRLKKARLDNELTQLETSAKANVSEKQVSAIERGYVISKPALEKLSNLFGLDPNEALEEVEKHEI